MPSLKEVKNRISSVISTQQITKAMKMVAAAKLRKAQDVILKFRPYAGKISSMQEDIALNLRDEDTITSPFLEVREVKKMLVIVIASDKGLCGAFNSSTFKMAVNLIENKYKEINSQGGLTVMPIGKKAAEFFKRRNFPINNRFVGIWHEFSYDKAREMAEYLMEGYASHAFDKVAIVYNEFKNAATQVLREEQYLPILSGFFVKEKRKSPIKEYIFEPSKTELIAELIPMSLKTQLYRVFLESAASEQGARMVAMEQATENAGELLAQLRLTYNRTRQATITREIIEIAAGAEALSSEG